MLTDANKAVLHFVSSETFVNDIRNYFEKFLLLKLFLNTRRGENANSIFVSNAK